MTPQLNSEIEAVLRALKEGRSLSEKSKWPWHVSIIEGDFLPAYGSDVFNLFKQKSEPSLGSASYPCPARLWKADHCQKRANGRGTFRSLKVISCRPTALMCSIYLSRNPRHRLDLLPIHVRPAYGRPSTGHYADSTWPVPVSVTSNGFASASCRNLDESKRAIFSIIRDAIFLSILRQHKRQ